MSARLGSEPDERAHPRIGPAVPSLADGASTWRRPGKNGGVSPETLSRIWWTLSTAVIARVEPSWPRQARLEGRGGSG